MAVLPTGIGPVTGYNIERSLRFNSADSAYLNRTLTTPTNNLKWTWSGWIKRSAAVDATIFSQGIGATNTYAHLYYSSTGELNFRQVNGSGTIVAAKTTTALYRDYSAWYHIILVYDSANATSTNRLLLYVNGVQITAFSSSTDPSLNLASYINSAAAHRISSVQYSPVLYYFDGYLTEINFIDGQALTPSSFGETDTNTGVWKPKAYTGTYGTNGFYLKFADNSGTTSTTLGKDYSGNGNNWTPNNFSVTAGAGNDSLVDSPTAYGTDTGVGGEVRGNYCTWNPLKRGGDIQAPTNGNLDVIAIGSAYGNILGTIGVSSGKWYWECVLNSGNGTFGIANDQILLSSYSGQTANGWSYEMNGNKGNNGSYTSYGASWTTGDVIGVALDMDAGTVAFYKNGASQGTAFTGLTGFIFPLASEDSSTADINATANFGQRAFAYTAPSGFKALCTQNLPTPTIGATSTTQAGKYFNTVLYTGDYTTSKSITGVGFQPDFVWIKDRGLATVYNYSHALFDAVRGAGKWISTNRTDAELDYGTGTTSAFRSFNSDGFTVGQNYNTNEVDPTAESFVAWNWKANGTGSTNTAGTITSTVSANTTSGFSIVTYTGTGANATVGHGLGVAPSMIIVKNRTDGTRDWLVYHASIGNTAAVFLNLTNASTAASAYWNNTSPTSSVFSLGNSSAGNGSTNSLVAYCFAPVAGYSAFGSYTGNGSADGPFVYTGFRPMFILFKQSSAAGNDWYIYDAVRSTYNVATHRLFPNSSAAEATNFNTLDILSNGWKVRDSNSAWNASGATYIYAAFAESPFKYSLAR